MKRHTIYNDAPWFHPETVVFLSSLLKPEWTIFETGSGSSTIWFSGRVKKVTSFEHSQLYYDEVKKIIENKGIKNVDLQLRPHYPEEGIWGFEKDEFDFISIDGLPEGRIKSVKTTLPYLKSGGYLLLDDSENKRYTEAIIFLNNWESHEFGKPKRTHHATIWKKP